MESVTIQPMTQKNWWVVVWLIGFFPVGLYYLWKKQDWPVKTKQALSLIVVFVLILFACVDELFIVRANAQSDAKEAYQTSVQDNGPRESGLEALLNRIAGE